MSIIVKGLSKHFGTQKAVDHLSFEAQPGQIVGFLGPNGAGKSTTMKMLCCYLKPTEGSATVAGYDIIDQPLQVRQQIGYLPEHNPLYEEMYVKEYLNFVASIHRIQNKNRRIEELIEMTGLGREQNKIIGTLSKGYRQRVGLAQAIIHDPQILILDEPTSGLDMNQLEDIRNLILEMGKQKTVIFSSHVMQEVQALCDRVIIINEGKLIADDPIENLQHRIAGGTNIYVQFLENNILTAPFSKISGLKGIEREGDFYIFRSDDKMDIRPDIFKCAVSNKYTIIEMKSEKLNVEFIFRQLTKNTVDA